MVILLLGGSASGKSGWAEGFAAALARQNGGPLLYLATMAAEDEESRRRVLRHRELRSGKGFTTVERATGLAGLELPSGAAVLVEDLGNLCANELFAPEGGGEQAVLLGLEHLRRRAAHLVLVGNEVFSDGENWSGGTADYLRLLARIQAACAAWAEAAGAVICGIPLWRKRPVESWFEELVKEAEPE